MEITSTELREISAAAERLFEVRARIMELEAQLKASMEEEKLIKEVTLPELMDGAGVAKVKLLTGEQITVKSVVRANISSEQEGAAFDWLRSNGHGDLIKRELTLQFGRGKDEEAQEVKAELAKKGYSVDDKMTIPWNTLSAWAREMLESGAELPQSISVFTGRQAVIK